MFFKPSKFNPYIDTSFEANVRRVSPFLGTLLVIVFGLMMMRIVYNGVNNLATQLNPGDAVNVFGTIILVSPKEPTYGSLVQFATTASGDMTKDAHTYIVTACFQDKKLVYQLAAKPNVKFLLTDPLEPGYDWNGGSAECSASLIYRVPKATGADLYMLDSVSFEVAARN